MEPRMTNSMAENNNDFICPVPNMAGFNPTAGLLPATRGQLLAFTNDQLIHILEFYDLNISDDRNLNLRSIFTNLNLPPPV